MADIAILTTKSYIILTIDGYVIVKRIQVESRLFRLSCDGSLISVEFEGESGNTLEPMKTRGIYT